MQTIIALAALSGFGLGLRIGLFGLISLTTLLACCLAASSLASLVAFDLIWAAIAVAAFQLAALGGMVAKHSHSGDEMQPVPVPIRHFGMDTQRPRAR